MIWALRHKNGVRRTAAAITDNRGKCDHWVAGFVTPGGHEQHQKGFAAIVAPKHPLHYFVYSSNHRSSPRFNNVSRVCCHKRMYSRPRGRNSLMSSMSSATVNEPSSLEIRVFSKSGILFNFVTKSWTHIEWADKRTFSLCRTLLISGF